MSSSSPDRAALCHCQLHIAVRLPLPFLQINTGLVEVCHDSWVVTHLHPHELLYDIGGRVRPSYRERAALTGMTWPPPPAPLPATTIPRRGRGAPRQHRWGWRGPRGKWQHPEAPTQSGGPLQKMSEGSEWSGCISSKITTSLSGIKLCT